MYAIQFREVTYSALDLFYPVPYCIWCFPDRQFLGDTCMAVWHTSKTYCCSTEHSTWHGLTLPWKEPFIVGKRSKQNKKKMQSQSGQNLDFQLAWNVDICGIYLAHTQGKFAFFLLQGTFNKNSLASSCFFLHTPESSDKTAQNWVSNTHLNTGWCRAEVEALRILMKILKSKYFSIKRDQEAGN